jgi:dienelactone hydrolase
VFHRRFFALCSLTLLAAMLWFTPSTSAAEPLPDTKPLTEDGDLAAKMVAGMHKYLNRELAAAPKNREAMWKVDKSSPEKYLESVKPHREAFKKMLGLIDTRLPPHLEYVTGPGEPAIVAECDKFKVFAVRWNVFPGVDGEGLLLEPKDKAVANAVVIPDAIWTPELICGLLKNEKSPIAFANRMATAGYRVIVPVLIDRNDTLSGNPKLSRATNLPHREFIHRMAYEMGRTLVGYEVQKVLSAVDWFHSMDKELDIYVVGVGEGGRVALHAAAADERITRVRCLCAYGARENSHEEPLDRNLWNEVREFGDAEVTALSNPNALWFAVGEKNDWPLWNGPSKGGKSGAAPGIIAAIPPNVVDAEWQRFVKLYDTHEGRTIFFNQEKAIPITDQRKNFDPSTRHKRQFDQLVAYTQKFWRDSELVRKAFWAKANPSTVETWEKTTEWYRDYFHTEVLGKLPEPTIPLNPRTRQVYDEKTWTGYEVMLDVYPDVFAQGILLLPKDLKPGEKRPVVVCQHGLEGTPRHTIDVEKNRTVYNHFSRRLVELGYIVYAPQNPYYGENVFRQIQRKANPLKLSLFSFIIRQHQRTLDWLETLPNVDPKRIAFYGLSYGGKTAMRVPAVEKRYCLSICSGDFNEWIGKNVSVDLDRSYMWTREYEMYEFDLGNTFNYAEMAFLIAPRPFMVERGHDDGVGTDEMVAYEFAKVRYLYDNKLKIGDRTTIEFFPGGHQINAKETFAFLKKNLQYP